MQGCAARYDDLYDDLTMTSNVEGLERVYHAARQQWDKVGETLPADWHAFLATQMPAPSL